MAAVSKECHQSTMEPNPAFAGCKQRMRSHSWQPRHNLGQELSLAFVKPFAAIILGKQHQTRLDKRLRQIRQDRYEGWTEGPMDRQRETDTELHTLFRKVLCYRRRYFFKTASQRWATLPLVFCLSKICYLLSVVNN